MLDLVHDIVADFAVAAHFDQRTTLGGNREAAEAAHAEGVMPTVAPAELIGEFVLEDERLFAIIVFNGVDGRRGDFVFLAHFLDFFKDGP